MAEFPMTAEQASAAAQTLGDVPGVRFVPSDDTGLTGTLHLPAEFADQIAGLDLDGLALAGAKDVRRREVDRRRDAAFDHGFVADLPGGGQTRFQMRPSDRLNWLDAGAQCDDEIAGGNGDAAGAVLRCAGDVNHDMTFAQARAILAAMTRHRDAIRRHSWQLKDAIEAAADPAALDAIDIEAGWPA